MSLYFGRMMTCLYSKTSPVSPSRTDPAKLVRNSSEYRRLAAFLAIGELPEILTALSSFRLLDDLVTQMGALPSSIKISLQFRPLFFFKLTFSSPGKLAVSLGERWLPGWVIWTDFVVRRLSSASSNSFGAVQTP